MKVTDLKKGMLIQSTSGAQLIISNHNQVYGPDQSMLQAIWPSKWSKNRRMIKFAMYLGTREELGFDQNAWGRRYALVDGKIMLIDRESWRYIKPAQQACK